MKLLILVSLIFSSLAFGFETQTECPMMKELNNRTNTKKNLKTSDRNTRPVNLRATRAQ